MLVSEVLDEGVKVCRGCGVGKPLSEFPSKKGRCRPCRTEQVRVSSLACYYRIKSDPVRWAAFQARRRRSQALNQAKKREYIRQYKVERGCIDCGYNAHHSALDLDHVSGEKAFGMASFGGRSWTQLFEEIQKCVVRCANCHRIKTWESGVWQKESKYRAG